MANRRMGFGLSRDMEIKRTDQYNNSIDQEQEARRWIEEVLEMELKPGAPSDEPLGMKEFALSLKSGEVLCSLMNTLLPGSVKRINKISTHNAVTAFKAMENISNFLEAAENYGVKKGDLFQTSDLYDGKEILSVRNTIHALGRRAQANGFNGPCLGPKEAASNIRNFDEDTLKAGQTVIGLQMGSNKGASQAGMNFGKSRSIMD